MFTAVPQRPFRYANPWDIPVEQRIAALCARSRRIAYFYPRPDTSTFRYRVFNMVEALTASPELDTSASFFSHDDAESADRFLERADVLVICRAFYNTSVGRIITKARARGIRVLFDVDDLIFDSQYTHLVLGTLDLKIQGDDVWDHWFGRIARLGATLRMCDGVIVTNSFLAERVQSFAPAMRPRIVPNFLNRTQQGVSEEIFTSKLASDFARDGTLAIGYFSGTPTHNLDFQIIADPLAKLLNEYRQLIIRIVGFLDLPASLAAHKERIEFIPLQDFVNLQRFIGQTEINVAPLQMNDFTNSKSELKFFEAGIVGTLTVASPTFTFAAAIQNERTGLLSGAHEWGERLAHAIDTVADRQRYSEMAEVTHETVRNNYAWDSFGEIILAAVSKTGDAPPCECPATSFSGRAR